MQLGSLHAAVSPTGTEKGVQPRVADHPTEDTPALGGPGLLQAEWVLQHGISDH